MYVFMDTWIYIVYGLNLPQTVDNLLKRKI